MNFYLLQLLGKWICFLAVSLVSFLGIDIEKKEFTATSNALKNVPVLTQIVPYEVITNYDSKIPSNITKTVVNGSDGLVYENIDGTTLVLEDPVNEQRVIGTGKYGIYNGIITGYGPDCSTCSGRGYVACRTEDNNAFNLINDGIYYQDDEYGNARVLAAALKEFPCGTIVEVDSPNLGKFIGIVMDTGYDMRKNYDLGIYHFDVAYSTEKDPDVPFTTNMSGNVKYSVQRWGW